jgi:hypothetical protein
MSQNIIELVAQLRHPDAAAAEQIIPAAQRERRLAQIISGAPPRTTQFSPGRRHMARGRLGTRRQTILLTALAAVLAAIVLASLGRGGTGAPPVARATVAFRPAGNADIIATVTDPFAAQRNLDAAFARHGLDITLRLLPVSPSLTGTVIYTGGSADASQIQPITGGKCLTGGGSCPVGLRIPVPFKGHGEITLGRPAKPGESYESQASAFAPGEPLHCSNLAGARVEHALARIRAAKLRPTWRQDTIVKEPDGSETGTSHVLTYAPTKNYIWEALMIARDKILIWTQPTRPPGHNVAGAPVEPGC